MNLQKLTLILTLLGILTLIFLSQTKPTQTGTIQSINPSNNKITIQLENIKTELILFDTSFISLKKGDTIKFQGKPDTYKNKKQIIISKLSKISNNINNNILPQNK
ncbi:hypothetical protein KAT36_00720 [Candidatus Pacearchaeota archaeon]|nr:hypothetical protein [Candidatus Pacearchaeota archaeon]